MVSVLVALWFAGFASAATVGAERAVEALFACDADFFDILKSERSAFRSQEVRSLFSEHLRTDIVRFDPPVEAFGLRVTSYRQDTVLNYGLKPAAFTWGFQVDETPVGTARALRKYFPGDKPFRGTVDMLQSTRGYPGQPGKFFAISKPRLAGEVGANLECHWGRKDLGNIWSLPDVVDLFFDTWDSKGRWWAWIVDWLG